LRNLSEEEQQFLSHGRKKRKQPQTEEAPETLDQLIVQGAFRFADAPVERFAVLDHRAEPAAMTAQRSTRSAVSAVASPPLVPAASCRLLNYVVTKIAAGVVALVQCKLR
jgi:hypothetical protein